MAKDLFSRMDRAADRAYKNTNKRLGIESDPSLARYRTLTDGDFRTIEQAYGADALIQYVQTMESRALKGARHGTK